MIYGYARVSTIDQDLSIQHAALAAAGCTVVRSEKVTGTSTEGRQELATLLQFLREGDAGESSQCTVQYLSRKR